ncbi:hypothetical protein HOR53_gp08 [Pectobacterium phage PP99]|uniref:Uncharacterized protein n=1 Tax=Pectobacterium phage PP99 TaxID=1932883 RepID=A0A1P8L616_9CAUD|nr:hypothetical protein HOR53_gp08 [Pectobacterium phage PP99]APW79700.1 hypothetical protein PP99_08 [Pectobacterium phage PP99]
MQNINDSLLAIIKGFDKITVKAALAEVDKMGVDVSSLNTKTREGFITSLDQLRISINEAAVVEEEATLMSELGYLEGEIKATIADAGKATFHLGELLLKAKDAHESTPDFLKWVDEKFGIKKAWAYRLMKVASVFQVDAWKATAVEVLYTLQSQATDSQLEQARDLAEAGNLNRKTLSELLEPVAPAIKQVEHPEPQSSQKLLQQAAESLIASAAEPQEAAPQLPESSVLDSKSQEDKEDLMELVRDLREQLALQQQQNAELMKQITEANKPRIAASNAPMLPQFSSACMYARLGLAAEDAADKAKILEAFKSLCKAGYGRQHEAYSLLDEARHKLIHAMEAAA